MRLVRVGGVWGRAGAEGVAGEVAAAGVGVRARAWAWEGKRKVRVQVLPTACLLHALA